MRKRSIRQVVALSVILAVFAQGCFSLRRPMKRFSTQEEAGSVQVAIQSIARFDDVYIDALQPRFEVSSEDALDAISQSQVSEIQRLRAVVAELQVSGAQRSVKQERVTEKGEMTKDTLTETRTSPTIDPAIKGPAAATLGLSPFTVEGQGIQLDPALQRRAAAAYLQEIALLNRYVQDAAVSRGTYPMVVRLLVTVSPSARREPYDAYTTVSLFTRGHRDYSDAVRELKSLESVSYTSYGSEIRAGSEDHKSTARTAAAALSGKAVTECSDAVEIIPLFVTDNLESSLNSVSNQRVITTSSQGTGFWANIAAAFGLRTQADDRDRSINRGLNSLYTISKLSGNTVEARFGANQANNDFEMISRTFNVTLLALVPTVARDEKFDYQTSELVGDVMRRTIPCKQLEFVADSAFRDAVRGKQVPGAFNSVKARQLGVMIRNWGFVDPDAATYLDHLLGLAQMDRHQEFQAYLSMNGARLRSGTSAVFDRSLSNTLWHDFVTLARASSRSYGRFEIPQSRPSTFFADAAVSLFDDGRETRLVAGSAQNISADGLRAVVEVFTGTAPSIRSTWFESRDVKVSPDERKATFTFASFAKTLKDETQIRVANVVVTKSPGRRPWDDQTSYRWTPMGSYVADGTIPVAPHPTVTMAVSSDTIRMKDGVGELLIGFTAADPAAPPTVIVDIAGAFIDTVTPPTLMPNGLLEVSGHGTYRLGLKNLSEDRRVVVRAKQKSGKTMIPIDEKTLEVRTK